jgi:hypothetical protein
MNGSGVSLAKCGGSAPELSEGAFDRVDALRAIV